jgi:ParB family chromosome partitioning protein
VYQIITGERRYHAACEAGVPEVPCWVQTPKEDEVLLHQIVENWQRADMHPYDLADALARLRDANGYSQKNLARETSKSEGEISKLLALLDLPPPVQKLAREDPSARITRRHLYAIREFPVEQQLSFLKRVQEQALAVADIEEIARKETVANGRPRRPGAPVSRHRFVTSHARVLFTFRRKEVTTEELLAAVEEVRSQVVGGK